MLTESLQDQASTVEFDLRSSERMRAIFMTHPVAWRVVRLTPGVLFLLGLVDVPLLGLPDAVVPALALWAGALLVLVTFCVDPLHRVSGRPITLTVDGVGVHTRRSATTTDRPWDRFTDWVDGREFIGLWYLRSTVAAVPKRAFTDPAQQSAFIAIVTTHLPVRGTASIG